MDMQENARVEAQVQEETETRATSYRPNQVLLIGLGGVGSRVVDRVMSQIPADRRAYTQAVVLDTNVNDLRKLRHIPEKNQIQLGSDITIGKYLSEHPDANDWLVQGKQLDLIRPMNTKNGAKQIRMVSRIALRATHEQGHLGRRIAAAINDINTADGKVDGNGLMVMVVCSIAGGTGAGTVIQVPMYLEEAIKDTYNNDKVQFECAMMMPNAFSTTLSNENFRSAKVNAYAVLRELMSLNTGRLRRFEYFDAHEVDTTDKRIAPYGRVMFFDGQNVKGEAITGAVDTVHVPLMADALTEYLFGGASGQITGALDNTLSALYRSGGSCRFGAVGKADLAYPRMLYKQYSIANWITSSISETWLFPDEEADKIYREKVRQARQEGKPKPPVEVKRGYYCTAVKEATNPFFKEIQMQLNAGTKNGNTGISKNCASAFWDDLVEPLIKKLILSNQTIIDEKYTTAQSLTRINAKDKHEGIRAAENALRALFKKYDEAGQSIATLVRGLMQPTEARKPEFYAKDETPYRLNTFVKAHNLHPVGLRCFLYELYELVEKVASRKVDVRRIDEFDDSDWSSLLSKRKDRASYIADELNDYEEQYTNRFRAEIAQEVLVCLKEYIREVEDMFNSVRKVQEFYQDSIRMCEERVTQLNNKQDTVIVGSTLSMVNCWALLKNQIHAGEGDDDVIDEELSKELNRLIYQGYFKHIDDSASTSVTLGDGNVFRIPTDYVNVLQTSLQRHFMNKIDTTYRAFFPADIVEAVQYDCGVKNFWNILEQQNPHLSVKNFACPSPLSSEYYELAKRNGVTAFNHVDVFNKLIAQAVRKSEPRCGMLVPGVAEGYVSHYSIMDPSILRVMTSTDDMDAVMMTQTKDEAQIIKGVSTSSVEGIDMTACFEGRSVDKIVYVSTYAALEPYHFSALLAPDSDPNAPQDAMNYYRPYREYITEVVTQPNTLTPHLDRRWHLADKLADITEAHTDSVRKHAARAFVYGFAYDTIAVTDGATVQFGDGVSEAFKRLDNNRLVKVNFLSEAEQAALYEVSEEEKRDKLNAVLNSIFERLLTDPVAATALIEHAEERLADDRKFGKTDFAKNLLTAENIADTEYRSILDVINGFYNGAVRAEHIGKGFAEDSTRYMFEVLMTTLFEQISVCAGGAADVKKLAYGAIEVLYLRAICDNDPEASTASAENHSEKDQAVTDLETDEAAFDALEALMGGVKSPSKAVTARRPFASPHGDFCKEKALRIIDQLLSERK